MEFTLFGISLTVIVMSLVKAAQSELGLSDKVANYIRAILMGGAYLLYNFAPNLAEMYPWFEQAVTLGGGFVAVVLGVLGYWSDAQRVSARVQGKR
jgi:hypothetical protein